MSMVIYISQESRHRSYCTVPEVSKFIAVLHVRISIALNRPNTFTWCLLFDFISSFLCLKLDGIVIPRVTSDACFMIIFSNSLLGLFVNITFDAFIYAICKCCDDYSFVLLSFDLNKSFFKLLWQSLFWIPMLSVSNFNFMDVQLSRWQAGDGISWRPSYGSKRAKYFKAPRILFYNFSVLNSQG